MMAEVLVRTYDGTYANEVEELLKSSEPEKALVDLEGGLGALAKDIRNLLRTLYAGEDVVSSSAAGSAPKQSLRQLVKNTSDTVGEDAQVVAQEREEVWRRAVTHRKKSVSLSFVQQKKRFGHR